LPLMQVARNSKSATQTNLTIRALGEDLEPIKIHVLSHFRKNVKVPGFRAGKAPAALVEKHVDQKLLLDEFMEHAINELYRQAVNQERLRPVSQPQVTLKKFVPFTELEFEADLETIGEVKLANYKTIKVAKKPVSVTAKEVNAVIGDLQKRMAERVEVKRAAKDGDEVVIDFSGSDEEGKPVNGAEGKDYPLVLGSKTFIPGFEEHVVGMKAGEDKEFEVTFPKDYGVAALQSKKITFNVSAKKVHELKEPKIDDEFAKKAGPFKNLADLKADIKKQLIAEREREAETQRENEIIQKLVEKSSVEIPETLVDEQLQRLEEEEKRNLVYRGQTWQEHLKEEGVTEEQHRERHRPDAELRVKAGLVLSEVADKEQITVQPEELDIRLQMLKGQYNDAAMQAELDKPEAQQDIAARLLTEKTVAKLVDYASK
jgi:trigger factor